MFNRYKFGAYTCEHCFEHPVNNPLNRGTRCVACIQTHLFAMYRRIVKVQDPKVRWYESYREEPQVVIGV